MKKELVFQEKDLSFSLFTPDFFIYMIKKKKEDTNQSIDTHLHISSINTHTRLGGLHPVLREK